jgi:molybdate/tungstate transport system ATP-binding protein
VRGDGSEAAGLALEDLSVAVGSFRLKQLSLTLAAGETLVILGPNGAGKSVTLETIAGFHSPAAGRIRVAGREVTRLPPERRRVSLVFQNFALFPHLTVAQNVAVAARARRRERRSAGSRDPASLLAWLGIAHLAARGTLGLSPGEKQRAALARALAADPDLFLFDEPFSALDAPTREQLRYELRGFLRETGIPAIFVTHDHDEAMSLADRVAVMRGGEILQSGAADAVFRTPGSRFVAEFVGIENLLEGRIVGHAGGLLALAAAGRTLQAAVPPPSAGEGGAVLVCIRAEAVRLGPFAGPSRPVNRLPARVLGVASHGVLSRVTLDCGCRLEACLMTRDLAALGIAPGAAVEAEIDAAAIHVMPM